jgi:hypothetical protein
VARTERATLIAFVRKRSRLLRQRKAELWRISAELHTRSADLKLNMQRLMNGKMNVGLNAYRLAQAAYYPQQGNTDSHTARP